jgi:phosphate transport system ATP-binding protein
MTATTTEAAAKTRPASRPADLRKPVIETRDVTVSYSGHEALHPTSLTFAGGEVTSLIGPSGCGKSTFLRSINLMNLEIDGCEVGGQVLYHGVDANAPGQDLFELRKHIGMVFQQPNPFHKSIYENIAFAPRRHGITKKADLDALVEESLKAAAIWDEVKDKLNESGFALSGGQQQRLCIARTLAMHPDVVLMDEPCSALDPIATFAVEDTIRSMASSGICIIIVTHNMEQAARVSDRCAFFLLGEMVETGPTAELFANPSDQRLDDYLSGRFG